MYALVTNLHSTLPGFNKLYGSRVFLSCLIISTPSCPISSMSNFFLPNPMPCSPVQVPSTVRARLKQEKDEKTMLKLYADIYALLS